MSAAMLTERAAEQLAQRQGAVLVVAKLDRLSCNVAFIDSLMESGVEFVTCNQPQANKFTLYLFAALAEQERDRIRSGPAAPCRCLRRRVSSRDAD